jgi:polar amino acid transport system substrate-binding protein
MVSGKSILTKSLAFSDTDEPEDLNDGSVKIAVLKGSNSEAFVKKEIPEAKIVLGNDYDECVNLLETGKVSLMVADYSMCAYIAQVYPEKGLITIEKPMSIEPIGIALPQDAAHFTNLVENYLNLLLVTGTLDEMQAFWFNSGDWVGSVK